MKRRAMKVLAMLMASMMLFSLLAGCGGKDQGSAPSGTDTAGQTPKQTEELQFPIVKQPITLTYFRAMDAKVSATMKTNNEIRCYQEAEKKTGIHIEFMHPPTGQEKEQLNLLLASDSMPDLMWYNWLSLPGGPGKLLQDGSIIKVNDAVNQYMPNFKKILESNKQIKMESSLDDGTLYMFPFVRYDESLRTCGGFQMRNDWLKKLNLKVPTNINEWYTVLTAFRDKDPNGNGQKDELPFVSAGIGGPQNFEMAYGMRHGFYMDKDKVKFSPVEPAYKEFITTMAKWYKEGLIDPDFAATDSKSYDAKITGGLAGSYQGAVNGNLGRFMRLMKDKDPNFDLVGVPWPVAPDGKSYGFRDRAVPGQGLAISKNNKYVKESAKWVDYAYTEEGTLLFNFGPPGEAYEMVNGYPKYKDFVLNNPNGLAFDQTAVKYGLAVGAEGPMLQDYRYYEQSLTDFLQKKAAVETWRKHDPSLILPPITPTAEESQRLASIMNEINTYVDEMYTKFIMGQEPLTNFDKYVQNIKNMKLDEALKIQQAALDRYNKRQ